MARLALDLNCDLGEGEPAARTRRLMRWITSANVACGGHAGDLRSMSLCIRLAKRHGIRLGAHPGWWDRAGFGRTRIRFRPEELELLLLQQVSALEKLARADGVRLHHIKLHGALYHASEADRSLARRYVSVVGRYWPQVKIYAFSGGMVVGLARKAGLSAWGEVFIDRRYRDDGFLVPRQETNAVISDCASIREQLSRLLTTRRIQVTSGRLLAVTPRTLCVHSDTPGAEAIARMTRLMVREQAKIEQADHP